MNSISVFLKRALTFSGCLFLLVGLTGCDPELYAKVRAAVVKAQPELTTAQHDKIAGDLMMAYEKAGGDKAPSLENFRYELEKAAESQPGFKKAYGAGWDVLITHWTAKQSGGGSGGGSGGVPFLPGGAGGGGGGGGGGIPVPTPSPQPTPPPRLTPVPTPPQQYGN